MEISFRDKRAERFWNFVSAVTRPALLVAPNSFLSDIRTSALASGIPAAVAAHETGPIFELLVDFIQYQGISNAAAYSYAEKHGNVRWVQIQSALLQKPSCVLLRSYWNFADCRYAKGLQTCAHPEHMPSCPLPRHPLRKGGLNQAAYSLFLFIRDICAGDLVGWIDDQLAAADSLLPGLGPAHPNAGCAPGSAEQRLRDFGKGALDGTGQPAAGRRSRSQTVG